MTDSKSEDDRAQQAIGVQHLLDRLREEGVEAGRKEADVLRQEAEDEAAAVVERAQAEAGRIVQEANATAAKTRAAGEEALRAATRDTVLRFSEEIMVHLRHRVERLISEEMVDRDLLRQVVVQVIQRSLDVPALHDASQLRVYLPAQPLGIDELKNDPEALKDALSQLVKQIAGSTWREGVTFRPAGSGEGIKVVVEEGGLEIDLSPQAVTELLMQHLRPRFRALMRGIIQ